LYEWRKDRIQIRGGKSQRFLKCASAVSDACCVFSLQKGTVRWLHEKMQSLLFAFEKPEETMSIKPSGNEEEYFAQQEMERRRRIAEEHQTQLKTEERERDRTLHFRRCPKCGLQLEEIVFGDVRVDKCFGYEGLWLDKGEFEALQTKEPSFVGRMLRAFR